MSETYLQARIDEKLAAELDSLVENDTKSLGIAMDRSKTIKRLIHLEFERRSNPELEEYRQQFHRAPCKEA